jgi:hypothetical protein
MHKSRRPAGDLIDAIIANMRSNLEELRYTTIAPSRYTVYVSQSEYARLEGILPRLRSETLRALNEELTRQNRRGSLRKAIRPLMRRFKPPLENAGAEWHVEFLPDMDGELKHDQDIIVHSELVLPAAPELGSGERTRRVSTVHSEQTAGSAPDLNALASVRAGTAERPKPHARLVYEDRTGPHQYDVVLQSTTIGRGGTMYPVNVRVATTDEVSREHARIRRSAETGHCFLIDLSTHGTTIDGHAVPKGFSEDGSGKRENGVETRLPATARIGLAGMVFLDFAKL